MDMRTVERDLPLFPLERVVLFPGMLLPLHIFEDRYKMMIGTCQVTDQTFGVLLIRKGREVGATAETEQIGCTARILEIDRLPEGRMNILAVGEQRFRLRDEPSVSPDGYLAAPATIVTQEAQLEVPEELVGKVRERVVRYIDGIARMAGKPAPAELKQFSDEPATLSFQVASILQVPSSERQRLLAEDDVVARLEQVQQLLRREVQTLRLMEGARGPGENIGPFSVN